MAVKMRKPDYWPALEEGEKMAGIQRERDAQRRSIINKDDCIRIRGANEHNLKNLTVKFPPAPRSGDVVFKATDLEVGYPQKVVFSHADIEIKRGEKVALIGRNGEGKTTLMRVIMGQLVPFAGQAKVGHNVHIGYYAQNQEDILLYFL